MIMPTLHRRSFSENHLCAIGSEVGHAEDDGENNIQEIKKDFDSKIEEAYNTEHPRLDPLDASGLENKQKYFNEPERFELNVANFNTAGVKGSKASRNVLNEVNKKADEL